jgi:putative sporulation protein YtxC
MVYELQVITMREKNRLGELINERLQWIKQRGYEVEMICQPLDEEMDSMVFKLHVTDQPQSVFQSDDILYICKHQLAEAIAEHIVNDWESRLLWHEIQRTCRSMSSQDKERLLAKAEEFIKSCHSSESLNMLMNFGRKSRIASRVMAYIQEAPQLVMDGFITFWMQDYMTEIKFAVEVAIEELRNEKEYNEFVNLLRYFVDTQPAKVQEVNLLMGSNGVFYLWDSDGTKIDESYMEYYLEDMLMEEIDLDDVLVSILVTIAPKRIIIHEGNAVIIKESVTMIRNVFQERIVTCPGCERCGKFAGNEAGLRRT